MIFYDAAEISILKSVWRLKSIRQNVKTFEEFFHSVQHRLPNSHRADLFVYLVHIRM